MKDARSPTSDEKGDSRQHVDIRSQEEMAALRSRLCSAVARSCPTWLADRMEDIVQNAMLQLIRSLEKNEGKQHFSSIYLTKAAWGATVDEIRRQSRRKESGVEHEMLSRIPTDEADPVREATSRELGMAIKQCLRGLNRARRLAVTLYLEGCAVPEVAERLGFTGKKAENLVYRGLAGLRRCLAAKGMRP